MVTKFQEYKLLVEKIPADKKYFIKETCLSNFYLNILKKEDRCLTVFFTGTL